MASKYLKEPSVKLGEAIEDYGLNVINITKEKGRILCGEKGFEKQILQ